MLMKLLPKGKKLMSNPPELEVRNSPKADAEVVFAVETGKSKSESRPQIQYSTYSPLLKKLTQAKAFTGGFKTTSFVRFAGKGGAKNVLFVGLGPEGQVTEEKVRQVGAISYA